MRPRVAILIRVGAPGIGDHCASGTRGNRVLKVVDTYHILARIVLFAPSMVTRRIGPVPFDKTPTIMTVLAVRPTR